MGNMNNATSGAMQGAQMGGQVGGAWGAVIGAVIGGVAGYNTADPVQLALDAQKKYNNLVVLNTATALFDRERAQQVERMRTARALQSYQAQGKTQISTLRANYGAADLVGASAQALAQTLDYQTKQAEAATMLNYGISFDNYLIAMNHITNQGMNSVQREINGSYMNNNFSIQSMMQQGQGMMGGMGGGGGGMFSNANSGGSGGIMGSGSGYGYSGTTTGYGSSGISNVNWGGGGSLGIS